MSTPWPSRAPRAFSGSLTNKRAGCGQALRDRGSGRGRGAVGEGEAGEGRARAGAGRLAPVSVEKELGKCLGRRGAEVSAWRRPRGSWSPGRAARVTRKPSSHWDEGSPAGQPTSPPSLGRQLRSPYSPGGFGSLRLLSRSFFQVPPPLPGPSCRPRHPRRPLPGLRGLTWGRGPALPTAPSSSSARRSGPGAPAMAGRSGLGHRCHLRNRARRLIPGGRRAAGAGEEPARGRPARGRGQAGSPAFCSARRVSQSVPGREVLSPAPLLLPAHPDLLLGVPD